MHTLRVQLLAIALLALATATSAHAGNWPQFRGVNSTGLAVGTAALPTEIGPNQNVVWKTPLPPGHSSPVLSEDRIFLTAVDDERLLTIALDRATGSILWRAEAPHAALEQIHTIGSYAQPSSTTDGELVVSFFGSAGLFCYDRDGHELWQRRMGPFKNTYGAAASPIIVGDAVLLQQDHDQDSFLLALDKRSGETLWQVQRDEFPRGFCTPVVWNNDDHQQLVVVGALRAIGYDLQTGAEAWTVRGLARISNITPVVAADGTLYITEWAPGADESDRIHAEPFADFTGKYDADKSGTVEYDELPVGAFKTRFPQIDRDKDERITQAEYDWMREIFNSAQNVVLAVKPGGQGDISESHVLWKQNRFLPYVPSPVYFDGLLLMVKDGGIVTSIDTQTGEFAKRGRLPQTGQYYSSPVVGDGKIYLLSQQGGLTVLSAQRDWQVLHTADFKEDAYATPALVDGRIYLRTDKHLYCFGTAE